MPFELSLRTDTQVTADPLATNRHPLASETLSEALRRITRLACQAMDAPYSSVVLLDGDMYRLGAAEGFPSEVESRLSHLPRHLVICDEVVRAGEMVEIADLRGRPFPETEAMVECLRMRSYLGAPIFAGGKAIGAIASFDTRRRTLSDTAQQVMLDLARLVETELRLRQSSRRDVAPTPARAELGHAVGRGSRTSRETGAPPTQRHVGVLRAIREGVCWLDRQGRVLFANPAAETMLLRAAGQLVGRSFDALARDPVRPVDRANCPIRRSLADGAERQVQGERFARGDGTSFQASFACVPVRDGDRVTGVMVIFHDSSAEVDRRTLELQSALQEIQRLQARFLASAMKPTARPGRDYRRWHGIREAGGRETLRKLAFAPKRSEMEEHPDLGTTLGPRETIAAGIGEGYARGVPGADPRRLAGGDRDVSRPRSRIERWSTF